MLGEADLKDFLFFFAKPIKTSIPTEYCLMQYTFCGLYFHPQLCDIKIIQCSLPEGHTKK